MATSNAGQDARRDRAYERAATAERLRKDRVTAVLREQELQRQEREAARHG